jgi:DNA polymerase-1
MAGKGKVGPTQPNAQLPLFLPESSWRPPTELKDLRKGATFIGFDTEGVDPKLQTHGPGYIRKDARCTGISLANDLGDKVYLPFGHPEDNMDKDLVIRYATDMLSGEEIKCGTNLGYDLEALWSEGIKVNGKLHDITVAEPLLDEERPGGYSLEAQAKTRLGVGKTETLLKEAAAALFPKGTNPKQVIGLLPARYVGMYGEDDAFLPIQIAKQQIAELDKEGLNPVFELERELTLVLFQMRLKGVAVDLDKTEQLVAESYVEAKQLEREMFELSGKPFDPMDRNDLVPIFQSLGIHVPKTAKGNFSITTPWLEFQTHVLCQKIIRWRKNLKMRRDFLQGLILENHVNGRLHPQWHQLRQNKDEHEAAQSEDDEVEQKGARSGRVTSSKPSLTVIPSRDKVWGPKIRSLFVADQGGFWGKGDYNQQEPRITLHHAVLKNYPGAAEACQKYINDKTTDYHQLTSDLIFERTGKKLERRHAKDINLGSTYGMGEEKMALKLGIDIEQAREILKIYHEGVPYVKKLEKHAMEIADANGFVRTILGRKRRFQMWEPAGYSEHERKAYRYEEAVKRYGPTLQRSYLHKALNAIVQGSAGDQMKTAIVTIAREGIIPQIQVYDELNNSYESEAQFKKVIDIMEHAIEMKVPFLVEPEKGPSWGQLKKVKELAA